MLPYCLMGIALLVLLVIYVELCPEGRAVDYMGRTFNRVSKIKATEDEVLQRTLGILILGELPSTVRYLRIKEGLRLDRKALDPEFGGKETWGLDLVLKYSTVYLSITNHPEKFPLNQLKKILSRDYGEIPF